MTDATNLLRATGTWEKLADESWGISVRFGGPADKRGDVGRHVGRALTVRRADGSTSTEVLGALVRDYGHGDVTIFYVGSL